MKTTGYIERCNPFFMRKRLQKRFEKTEVSELPFPASNTLFLFPFRNAFWDKHFAGSSILQVGLGGVSFCVIAVRLRVKKKVQNLSAMWYKEFAKNFATQGDFGHESP